MNTYIEPLINDFRKELLSYPHLASFGLESLVKPSIRISTEQVPYSQMAIGESRIGGVPDLPPSIEWPHWSPSETRDDVFGKPLATSNPIPLGFIAQIDLTDILRIDKSLPDSGRLYFFYDRFSEPWGFDPNDRGGCRVIYDNTDSTKLIRADFPSDFEPRHKSDMCRIETWPELTLPDEVEEIKYDTPEYQAYTRLQEGFDKGTKETCHRFLGHPKLIQAPMELECQLASNGINCGGGDGYQSDEAKALEAGAADWRLLLQIDTDEDGPGWMWGDCGMVYFWIRKQDLVARNFDNVWLVLQCS